MDRFTKEKLLKEWQEKFGNFTVPALLVFPGVQGVEPREEFYSQV